MMKTRQEIEHEIRVAFTESKGDDSQRQNAYDTLAEAGISRIHSRSIMAIFDWCSSEESAIAQIQADLPAVFI